MSDGQANIGLGALPVGPDGLIPELPCVQCSKPTLSVREMGNASGETVAWAYMCRSCQGDTDREYRRLRAIFEALTADGMSRDLANDVMIRWHLR